MKQGGTASIKRGYEEERIVADWLESGLGYRATTLLVSTYLSGIREDIVSRWAVKNAATNIKLIVNRIENRHQGNKTVQHGRKQVKISVYKI